MIKYNNNKCPACKKLTMSEEVNDTGDFVTIECLTCGYEIVIPIEEWLENLKIQAPYGVFISETFNGSFEIDLFKNKEDYRSFFAEVQGKPGIDEYNIKYIRILRDDDENGIIGIYV